MKKRARIFRSMSSNVRTAPKHIDRKIQERKLQVYGHIAKGNEQKFAALERLIQSEFRALDEGLKP